MGEPHSVKGIPDLAPAEVPEEPVIAEDDLLGPALTLSPETRTFFSRM